MKNTVTEEVPTTFLNVQVIAIPNIKGDGTVSYDTTFIPERLTVTEVDTVINYQLISPTPADVKFKDLTIKPDGYNQFSEPSISESGKIVTFSDANTVATTFNVKIKFTNKDNQEFLVDPEVDNDPRPPMTGLLAAHCELEPEADNDPRA